MQELVFQIQGSAPEPYEVRIVRREGNNLSAYCTCPAADSGKHCKHRVGILTGKPEGIVGKRDIDISTVQSWVRGTDIENVLHELQKAEDHLESIKNEVARLKKTLAKVMLD